MIRILIILILLTGCSKSIDGSSMRVENSLTAMDNFWDKLTQNATPADKE